MDDSKRIIIDQTEREYYLTAKILISKHGYIDQQSDGRNVNRETFFVFFIPVHNSQGYAFFDAWLPLNNEKEQVEIAMHLKHPFSINARGCVRRADARCPYHHIMLMSYGLAQLIIDKRDTFQGREIQLVVFSEHDDALADNTHKGDLPFEKKQYSTTEISDDSHLGRSIKRLNDRTVFEASDHENQVHVLSGVESGVESNNNLNQKPLVSPSSENW